MDNETIIFETPKIYFPKLFTAVSKTVPHIELTSDAAVTTGYSFRKKRHSVKIINYHGRSHKELILPYSIDGMPVDEICGHAFENYPCTVIYIHGNIRRLGEGVFRGSTVRKVIFEDGITSLPKNAFAYCKTLEQVELPLTLKHIGYECFFVCKSLKYIEFPKSICTIENRAFLSCGLENFAVEAPTQGINNAYAFVSYAVSPPMFVDNQVVCTYPDPSNLTVLYVNGGPYRLKADSVTFCRWSLKSNSLDLSDCKKVSFYRNAICNGRKRDDKDIGYGVSHCKIILPERNEDKHHYAFSEHVTVIYNFSQKDRLYTKPYEIEYDSTDDTYNITPVADYLPPWTIEEECEIIRIKGHVHIDRNAINCRNLKEITFEDFCPEDRVFSLSCSELRKVSFNYKGQMVTKYISPGELVSGIVNELMILSFAPCSAPNENGSKRTVYDRESIDLIFNAKYASTANNRSIARLKRIRDFAYHSRWIDFNSKVSPFRVSNKRKAIVAVDILRSDRLDHEPPVDMYYDFLRTHRSFCLKYFTKISDKYPEYLQAFEMIMSDDGIGKE